LRPRLAAGLPFFRPRPPLSAAPSVGHGQPNGYMPGGHDFGTFPTNFREPSFWATGRPRTDAPDKPLASQGARSRDNRERPANRRVSIARLAFAQYRVMRAIEPTGRLPRYRAEARERDPRDRNSVISRAFVAITRPRAFRCRRYCLARPSPIHGLPIGWSFCVLRILRPSWDASLREAEAADAGGPVPLTPPS